MERCNQAGKVDWLSLTIYGGGFLRFIMDDMGYGLDNGLVVITNDEIQARQYIREYESKTGDKRCQVASWKRRRTYPPNFCCGFMTMKKGLTVEEAEEFLTEKDFLPIIVSGGMFPDYLKDGHYIFRLKKADLENVKTKEFETEMKGFWDFVTENVAEVCQVLEELESSIAVSEYEGEEQFRCIYTFLMGVGSVYAAYLRKRQTERRVLYFWDKFKRETSERILLIPEFASGEVLRDMISGLVWEFLYEKKDIVVAASDNMNEQVERAIRENEAILYDEKKYCFSPKLFIKICAPLLQTASETDLKRKLREEGIIYCNSADYTIKLSFRNIYMEQLSDFDFSG